MKYLLAMKMNICAESRRMNGSLRSWIAEEYPWPSMEEHILGLPSASRANCKEVITRELLIYLEVPSKLVAVRFQLGTVLLPGGSTLPSSSRALQLLPYYYYILNELGYIGVSLSSRLLTRTFCIICLICTTEHPHD